MSKVLSSFLMLFACMALVGCGGAVDEVPPLTEGGNDPPAEQQKDWMEESMKQGGAPKGYKPEEEKDKK